MIKNIVFDMGRVLIMFDQDYYIEKENVTDPDDMEILRREVYQSYLWAMTDRGTLTPEDAVEKMCLNIPEHLHSAAHNLVLDFGKNLRSLPGMGDVVRELKKNGYKIYVLSNASRYQSSYWMKVDGSDCFDGSVISSDYKIVKPEREIYELFLSKFGVNADECVFIDDVPANIEAAIQVGINGIVFHQDISELRRKLRKMGVNISE